MVSEYDNGALIYLDLPYESNYEDVRSESSILLHKILLELEAYLYQNNNSIALSFIGGSCKLCKNGCDNKGCRQPYKSRSPVEAIGINIIKSAEKYGIKINFPPNGSMVRIGLLLW